MTEIKRYGLRNWAVYCGGELLAVTVYLKGARAVAAKINQLEKPYENCIDKSNYGGRGIVPAPELAAAPHG
jgi:hypothetical protein